MTLDILQCPAKKGKYPMHYAAQYGDKSLVLALAGIGVAVEVADVVGDTPLHLAVRSRNGRTAAALDSLGANAYATNQRDESPLSLGLVGLLAEVKRAEVEELEKEIREMERQQAEEEEREWRERLAENLEGEELLDHYEREYSGYSTTAAGNWFDEIRRSYQARFARPPPPPPPAAPPKAPPPIGPAGPPAPPPLAPAARQEAHLQQLRAQDERRWAEFKQRGDEIKAEDIPWPSGDKENRFNIPHSVGLAPLTTKILAEERTRLKRLLQLRWHPDKFEQLYGRRLAPTSRTAVLARVTELSQHLNQFFDSK